jgi:glucosylceramidase
MLVLETVEPETGEVIFNREYYIMKHYSHYIKRGSKSINLCRHWTAIALALKNPNGNIVLVTTNPFKRDLAVKLIIKDCEYAINLNADTINTILIE